MKKFLSEKDYQHYIIDYLARENGYIKRTNGDIDRLFALDRELLFRFLKTTQGDALAELKRVFKKDLEKTIVGAINTAVISSSLFETLRHGVEINHTHLTLLYTKPETSFNEELVKKYKSNILSIAEEVWANDKEWVDLVVCLNGFVIITMELKCNAAGQSYEDAIRQFRLERDPKSRLFLFKAGAIVHFALDLQECHMTTKLSREATFFLPFNKGVGKGINSGKGNPINKDGFGVSYLWGDVLKKDALVEILTKFIFVERKSQDGANGKTKKSVNIIFPRFHQLDCIRRVVGDVRESRCAQNFLIQHSAGSGKTYTIAWLAHRLATLHDKLDKVVFDNVIIVTDRIVVDRQLQRAVRAIDHKPGMIAVIDDGKSSDDLRRALEGNTKIIATTIQKFRYIVENTRGLEKKTFAVIIDEAHSSTAGKNMGAVTGTLGSGKEETEEDLTEALSKDIAKKGKQSNVAFFAFTATPKATTLHLFGRLNTSGCYEAYHLYSMKQAIEEGFILNVLGSFTPYSTFYKINKTIEDDPEYKTNAAKRKIVRFAILHDENIVQRTAVMVEHFRNVVLKEQPWAKAMVVTGSRVEAVKYLNAFRKYVKEHGYQNANALVAFSGKLSNKEIGMLGGDVTEASLNGFSDKLTQKTFDKDGFQFIIVANKYQTGFDQPKLSAMYVLKKMFGIATVQTLSRLNRICPPFDKKTFILDFVNNIEDIIEDFKPYYTTTILSNIVTQELIYSLDARVDEFNLFDLEVVTACNQLFFDKNIKPTKREEKINAYLMQVKVDFDARDEKEQREILLTLRKFVQYYEFFVQATSYEDINLHMKYYFITWLLPYLKIGSSGAGVNLKGKIEATDFYQKKGDEISHPIFVPDPAISLPSVEELGLSDDEEKRLSEIIVEINNKTGMSFDNDVAVKAALQIRDILRKNKDLIVSAKENPLSDFAFPFYRNIDQALQEGWNQNQEFYSLLLNNEVFKKEILGLFMNGIYNDLKRKE